MIDHFRKATKMVSVCALLTACNTIPVKLPVPPLEPLPELTESELACVSQPTYERIVQLDAACRVNIDKLRSVIESTH